MDRVKMPRKDRAKQFAPFDALKGLHDALKLKEYQHEKIAKGEMSEDDAKAISDVLISLEDDDLVNLIYFDDGYHKTYKGKIILDANERKIFLDKKEICIDNLVKIEKINLK